MAEKPSSCHWIAFDFDLKVSNSSSAVMTTLSSHEKYPLPTPLLKSCSLLLDLNLSSWSGGKITLSRSWPLVHFPLCEASRNGTSPFLFLPDPKKSLFRLAFIRTVFAPLKDTSTFPLGFHRPRDVPCTFPNHPSRDFRPDDHIFVNLRFFERLIPFLGFSSLPLFRCSSFPFFLSGCPFRNFTNTNRVFFRELQH